MTVDLNALLTLLLLLSGLIGALVAAFLRIKKWVSDVAKSSRATAEQLETTDDKTIADHVQESSREIGRINGHIEKLMKTAQENRDRSIRAETLAESAHVRIDRHLMNDHGVHVTPQSHE
jgi:TolA-binding protein